MCLNGYFAYITIHFSSLSFSFSRCSGIFFSLLDYDYYNRCCFCCCRLHILDVQKRLKTAPNVLIWTWWFSSPKTTYIYIMYTHSCSFSVSHCGSFVHLLANACSLAAAVNFLGAIDTLCSCSRHRHGVVDPVEHSTKIKLECIEKPTWGGGAPMQSIFRITQSQIKKAFVAMTVTFTHFVGLRNTHTQTDGTCISLCGVIKLRLIVSLFPIFNLFTFVCVRVPCVIHENKSTNKTKKNDK